MFDKGPRTKDRQTRGRGPSRGNMCLVMSLLLNTPHINCRRLDSSKEVRTRIKTTTRHLRLMDQEGLSLENRRVDSV